MRFSENRELKFLELKFVEISIKIFHSVLKTLYFFFEWIYNNPLWQIY